MEEQKKLKEIQRMYNETWQENEVSIVIKMLDQSMKENNTERIIELEKCLLELERKSDMQTNEGSPSIKPISSNIHSFAAVESFNGSPRSVNSPFSLDEEEYLQKAIIQNTKQYDEQITIMLIGDKETGKTSLMNSWLGLPNPSKTQRTLGYSAKPMNRLDSKTIIRKHMGMRIRYKIIDSEGTKSKEFIKKGKG